MFITSTLILVDMHRRDFIKNISFSMIYLALPRMKETINISAAGDVVLPEKYPFGKVAKYFRDSIGFVNLEGALTDSSKAITKQFTFKSNPESAKYLKSANISVVNLANNHFMDYGIDGALDTLKALDAAGVKYCGGGADFRKASSPVVIPGAISVAFLGYALVGRSYQAMEQKPGTYPFRLVENVRDIADIVVVSCHWGKELETRQNLEQETVGRGFINAGADLVLGHHPHVTQPIEEYKKGLIYYSLGNFVFGHNRDSIIARITLSKKGIEYYETIQIISNKIEPFPNL